MLVYLDLQEGLGGAGRETSRAKEQAQDQRVKGGEGNLRISAEISRRHFTRLKQWNISTRNVRHLTCPVLVSACPAWWDNARLNPRQSMPVKRAEAPAETYL